jgi:uncharacterized protein
MNEQAVRGTIGLAMRAGQAVLGLDLAVRAIRSGKAAVALLDDGASPNAKKRLTDSAAYYQVPLFSLPEGLLDAASGKDGRVAAVILKGEIARKLISLMTSAESK